MMKNSLEPLATNTLQPLATNTLIITGVGSEYFNQKLEIIQNLTFGIELPTIDEYL